MAFDITRYPFIVSDDLGQRWISLPERLGAPETTLKAYASDLNDYLRWSSSRRRPPYPLALDGIADYVRDMREGRHVEVNGARSAVRSASRQRRCTDE